MCEVNSVCFDLKKYDEDEYEMWEDICSALRSLIRNDYTVMIRDGDCGLVILEFEHSNPELGVRQPYWLSEDEALSVVWDNDDSKDGDTEEYEYYF